MITNEEKIAKEIEEAMDLPKLPKVSTLAEQKAYTTHITRLDQLIEEMRMTIRILEEARKRF